MIHFFNRKELMITWSMTELANIRDILASNKVAYTVKTGNLTRTSPYSAGTRARTGSFGIRTDAMYQYTIYVRNTDYEKARYLIGR